MAEIVRRRSWGGVLPLGRHVSISGSSFIQCASASIAPPHPGEAKCYPSAEVQGRTGSNTFVAVGSNSGEARRETETGHVHAAPPLPFLGLASRRCGSSRVPRRCSACEPYHPSFFQAVQRG